MSFLTVAAATLPSVPLDFEGNRDRILESIKVAKRMGARVRTGPELEIPGYGCLDRKELKFYFVDHTLTMIILFLDHLEGDTFAHSWEVLAHIISDEACKDMLVDLGMGCRHRNVRYNCRVLCTYKKVLFIRPKMSLANDGLYREARHFTAWVKPMQTETYYLEEVIEKVTGQRTVPIGDAILSTRDTAIGCETCEELFTPRNPSTYMSLNGCEIILNSSASHAELRKLRTRLDLIANSTRKTGGCYVYANATGVDGEARMMFDGSSMILLNGKVLEQGNQFSLEPVEVITATINLEEIRSFRSSISRNVQAAAQADYPRVEFDIRLSCSAEDIYLSDSLRFSSEKDLHILDPMPEIWMSTSVYLWQYLVRTSSAGFFLSLSGGLDSSTVALFVYGMAKVVLSSIESGSKSTLADLRRVTGLKDLVPKTPEEIVNLLLTTCYMGTVNSSEETRLRAEILSKKIGAYHMSIQIDTAVQANLSIIKDALHFEPRYTVEGGTQAENLALQNIQARSRLVTQYMLAQLATTARDTPRKGSALLVLTSGNVDENLRGYYTKYDASSGDLAPLGSIGKTMRNFSRGRSPQVILRLNPLMTLHRWVIDAWNLPIMNSFIEATPTAELLPLTAGVQEDEVEMGLSYAELSTFGLLRRVARLGPWSCYLQLLGSWKGKWTPQQIAEKTMIFFRNYAINRHKAVILTPSVHLSAYNPDDNRHDLRPFLYVVNWPFQFKKIQAHAMHLEEMMKNKE
ncbi:NAD+ synthase [Xylaria cubensis]|nr:NAD+ synthase [Xylaria cubensis]